MTDFSWTPDPDSGITTRFVQANGITFELAECGAGPRLALCLHGFPELNFSWRHQMPLLAQKGWRVWVPNQRGYGASSRPEGVRAYGLDHLTTDVAALIDAAAAESPVEEVMLVAHDWGAIVAWAFAILKLRPLTKLVIMNVPHPKVAEREIRRWAQLKKSWYIFFFQLPWIPERALLAKDAEFVRGAFLNMAV
ncbi:MAG TPA: alpha/beta fold hydrolase, partial [Chakrabartia sp.]|nr:alpha/beta fold hydrolase [Chakrabartia sp.]